MIQSKVTSGFAVAQFETAVLNNTATAHQGLSVILPDGTIGAIAASKIGGGSGLDITATHWD